MKDVEKTNVERDNSFKRLRRRRRNMGLYGLIVIILVLGIGITVSCTFLFNINEIKISGESRDYSVEEIIKASGIHMGDNLIRLDVEEAERSIVETLTSVEAVKIDKDYPAGLNINVQGCTPAYYVPYELGTILISGRGKILKNDEIISEAYPVIYGYEPYDTKCGNFINVRNDDLQPVKEFGELQEQKTEIFNELLKVLKGEREKTVASVDMSNTSNMVVRFRDGNIFKMGNWNDIDYKISLAEQVIEQVDGKKGFITMIGTNQCSFRNDDGSFSSSVIADQSAIDVAIQSTTKNKDNEHENDDDNNDNNDDNDDSYSGQVYQEEFTEEETTEYIDPEEAMFREHDERVFSSSQEDED